MDTKKFSVMIVDDEAPARSELHYLLDQTNRISNIVEATGARDAVNKIIEARPDVMFLDISMPKTSGMHLADALHKLKNPPVVVFVTAYSEYAVQAFNVDAVDYLVKPVEIDRLNEALDKVEKRLASKASSHHVEKIAVEKAGHKVLIPIEEIRCIEAKDDYTCISTADDRYLSTSSLTKFEERLKDFGFFRVHRASIVNLEYIEDVTVGANGIMHLSLNGIEGRTISVSRRRVVQLRRLIGL